MRQQGGPRFPLAEASDYFARHFVRYEDGLRHQRLFDSLFQIDFINDVTAQ
jgi:hypothetical protein